MSCAVGRRVVNPHYKKIAPDTHYRLYGERDDYFIDVPCGVCVNCLQKYKSSWRFRLINEFKYYTKEKLSKSYYVTLTMENQYYVESKSEMKILVRRFLERVRKDTTKSIRHFFISERGDDPEGKNRIHLHGFLFDTDINPAKIWSYWRYGFVDVQNVLKLNEPLLKKICYVTSYVTKEVNELIIDKLDKPYVFVSPGLGKSYTEDIYNLTYHHQNNKLVPFALDNGHIRSLPRYYRLKVFTDTERELMKKDYFKNLSEDVLPPPPYYLGKQVYNDYTVYLKELDKVKKLYYEKYPLYLKFSNLDIDYGNEFNEVIH